MPSAASTAAPATIDLCCSSGVSDPEEEEQVGAKTTTTARTGTETGTGVDVVPARLSTPDWMGNLPSWARARPLSRLAIPGSHNSFTYSIDKDSPLGPDHSPRLVNFANRCSWLTKPVIYRWAVCQKISVTGQLELGVRYFDLRLCKEYFKLMEDIRKEEVERMNSKRKRKRWRKRWKGTSKLERAAISRSTPDASALRTHAAEGRSRTEICVLHALFGCDIECALTEINTFLAKHPREVVILDFQHVYGFQMTNDHFLTKMIIQLFKEKMYPRCDSHPASLEYLNDHGYQVIAVNSVGAKHSKLFWPRRMFRNPWADTTDLEVLFNFLNDRLEERDLDSFFVSQAILTPRPRTVILHPFCNLENCLARKCNDMISERWIPHVRREACEVNVVITDFVEKGSIVEDVIRLNYDRRLTTAYTRARARGKRAKGDEEDAGNQKAAEAEDKAENEDEDEGMAKTKRDQEKLKADG